MKLLDWGRGGGGFPVILIGMRGVFNSGGVMREGRGEEYDLSVEMD
jgi:alpha/beta superfamily hydrolase